MNNEELLKLPPEKLRNCADCVYLKAYVNWWCINKEAIEARGTSIPGVNFCPYWKSKIHSTFIQPRAFKYFWMPLAYISVFCLFIFLLILFI